MQLLTPSFIQKRTALIQTTSIHKMGLQFNSYDQSNQYTIAIIKLSSLSNCPVIKLFSNNSNQCAIVMIELSSLPNYPVIGLFSNKYLLLQFMFSHLLKTQIYFNSFSRKFQNKVRVSTSEYVSVIVKDMSMTTKRLCFTFLFISNKKIHTQATLLREIIDATYFIHFSKKTGVKKRILRNDTTHLNELVLQFHNSRSHVAKKLKYF